MAKVKVLARRALRAGRVVLHDPKVERAGKSLAAILAARAVVALGGSAATVDLVLKVLHAVGI